MSASSHFGSDEPHITPAFKANVSVEYIVVSDKNSKVLLSTQVWGEAVKFANRCRDAGGEVTIFKSTKG